MPIRYVCGMKLAAYLADRKQTAGAFAKRIRVTQPAVSRYVRGLRVPEPDVMKRIRAETNGAVTADDFYDDDESPPEMGAAA